jgi:hypothetical protein
MRMLRSDCAATAFTWLLHGLRLCKKDSALVAKWVMRAACKRLRPLQYLQSARLASTDAPPSVADEVISFVREHRPQNKHQEALDILQSGLAAQKGNKTGVSAGR